MKTKEDRLETVGEILAQCMDLNAFERPPYLDALDLDAAIRSEVESLLSFSEAAETFMNLSAIEIAGDYFPDDKEGKSVAGQTIGIYEVVREIGSGGMGTVYLAERSDGKFEQRVALKLLRREINTAVIRARFRQESDILASLEHPNIARLIDTGATNDNIPYIAMEYVEGVAIDSYCIEQHLDLDRRLEIFIDVCRAVDFAHRNLIVHRDLKPSNILVSDAGKPKLLDFGISKILSGDFFSSDSASVTKLGVMTPGYASPEQIQRKSVSTASDIYSLGVILYEMLCGSRPFENREGDLKQMYSAIIETDPPLPSSILETTRNTIPADPVPLSSQSLRGDLDNIIVKALSKEPERRYSSAENLAADLERHLRGLPVTARPNTFLYRAEKFVKRNSIAVIAGAVVILALFAGVTATLWQTRVANDERDRARREAEKAEKVSSYLQNILNFSNPGWLSSNPEQNRRATVAEALDEAVKNIDMDLQGQPETAAEVLYTIGQTYVFQGQYKKAEDLLRRAIDKFDEVNGPNNLKSMRTLVILADTMYLLGKPNEAEGLYTKAITYFRPVVAESGENAKWLAIALTDISNVYSVNGNFAEAEKVNRESLEIAETLTGKDRFMIPVILTNLAAASGRQGNFVSAKEFFRRAIAEARQQGNDQKFEGGGPFFHLGIMQNLIGEYAEAESSLKSAIEIFQRTVGERNIYTSSAMSHLAVCYYNQREYEKAEVLLKKTLRIQRDLWPKGHYLAELSRQRLGDVYTRTNRLKMGEREIRSALDYLSKNVKDTSPELATVKASLAANLLAQGKYDEAKVLIASALESSMNSNGSEHPVTKERRELLGKIPD